MPNNTLLIIGYVWPEPKSSAAGSRMLQLIELFLQDNWKIIFASAAALSEHRFDLTHLGIEEKIIALNDSSFDDYINTLQPNAVLFDRFFTEEQFGWRIEKVCPNALRLLDTEDLHSLRHARHKLLKLNQQTATNEIARQSIGPVLASSETLYAAMAQDDMAQREIAAIFRCDLSLMISEYEIELLHNYFQVPEQLLFYCPFIKSKADGRTSLPIFSERKHFVVIGNFRHEPNWDSVLYLKHAIWPTIFSHFKNRNENIELHIYGAYPPPKATQLHQFKEGFYIKGWADDAMEVIRSARVCLAPLRFGAGIKGKLMDAMTCGTPNVTTTIGAESMHGSYPWGGFIENSAEEFVAAAIKLYSDEQIWQESQRNGFSIIDNYFSRMDYGQLFAERVHQLLGSFNQERNANFIGGMLRHHTLKSTQYMSQWIEAKNKK